MVYNFGDIHIKKNRDKETILWERNAEYLYSFFKNMAFTKEDELVFTGDVFDVPKNNGHLNEYVLRIFLLLASKVKHIYVVNGNHETALQNGSALKILQVIDNLTLFETIGHANLQTGPCLFLPFMEGVTFNGVYENKVNTYCLENNLTDFFCIYGHGATKYSKLFDMAYLDIDMLNVTFKFMVMGDIHKPDMWEHKDSFVTSTGSFWADDKGERNYPFSYTYFNPELVTVPLDKNLFMSFKEISYPQDFTSFVQEENKFYLVKLQCKKEEKTTIDRELRAKIKTNLYYIEYIFEDVEKEESIFFKTEDDIVEHFFTENKTANSVKDLVRTYLKKQEGAN